MIKRDELSSSASCLNKAYDDEPVFVLRAKDPALLETLHFWMDKRRRMGLPDKRAETGHLIRMATVWRRNNPDKCKFPLSRTVNSESPDSKEEGKGGN